MRVYFNLLMLCNISLLQSYAMIDIFQLLSDLYSNYCYLSCAMEI